MSIFKYGLVSFAGFHQLYQAVVVWWIKMSFNYYLAGICSSKTVILKEFNSAATRTKSKIKQEDFRFVVCVRMGTLSVWPSHVSNAQKTRTTLALLIESSFVVKGGEYQLNQKELWKINQGLIVSDRYLCPEQSGATRDWVHATPHHTHTRTHRHTKPGSALIH